MVILVSGLPGSGKSFFAGKLAEETRSEYLSTDLLRKEMFPERTYSEEEKLMVYRKMKEGMIHALRRNKSIILDGTFHLKKVREEFSSAAEEAGEPVIIIYVTASEDTILKRVSGPRPDSEAGPDIYYRIKNEFEPLEEPHLVVDSEGPVEKMIEKVIQYIRSELS